MRQSLERRLGCVERVLAAHRRTHYLWRDDDVTDEAHKARIRAMKASGEAGPNDRFVTFRWRAPAGDGG
jgi:hypothetical protein